MDIQQLAKSLSSNGTKDPIRNKPRIEIPAAVALITNDRLLLKKNLQIILDQQQPDGYWLEYSYEPKEPAAGCYGAIPTAFCILALVQGHAVLKDDSYLHAAITACDYLYRYERSGYFLKADNNKSDVLNTNLMCGLALLKTSKAIHPSARRVQIYRAACARAIRRALSSQFANGAFPYTTRGITVPFLYHSMTLALLIKLSEEFKDSLLDYSILKGTCYLRSYLRKDGCVEWKNERFHDKSGACWIYAWNYAVLSGLGLKDAQQSMRQIQRLQGKTFLREGDISKTEDPFYSAWCLVALSQQARISPKCTLFGSMRFYIQRILARVQRTSLYCRIVCRKLFSFGLDKGPVEYW